MWGPPPVTELRGSACRVVRPVTRTPCPQLRVCCLLSVSLARRDRSWQGGVCKHESWHFFIRSLAPTSSEHLRGLFLERRDLSHSESLGKKRNRALERGSCDPDGPFLVACGSRLLASLRTVTAEQATRGHSEVARLLLGSFTWSPQPRGQGPQAGDRPVQIPGALSHRVLACSRPPPSPGLGFPLRAVAVSTKPKERPDPAAHSPPGTQF